MLFIEFSECTLSFEHLKKNEPISLITSEINDFE